MIPLSISQKNIVLSIFDDDIKLVKKYFMAISFDFDERFKYEVFKEFIYAAAGMFKDIDIGIYNQQLIGKFKTIQRLDAGYQLFRKKSRYALKLYESDFLGAQDAYTEVLEKYNVLRAMLQSLITSEKNLYNMRLSLEKDFSEQSAVLDKTERDALEKKLKHVRREHVDTLHKLGEHRKELEELDGVLTAFEEQHKAEFMSYFKSVAEKLEYQYTHSLSYFGYEFNKALFINSEKSSEIQKFKKEANIDGDINLCKYVEYYLRNINPDALADPKRKVLLNEAKKYCQEHTEEENYF
jgi:hypothetical protein